MTQHTGPLPTGFDERTSIRLFQAPDMDRPQIIISHPAFPPHFWNEKEKDWAPVL